MTRPAPADQGQPDLDVVLSSRDRGVELLTFNRPARLNAWNASMESRYFDLLEVADRSPDVRVIAVTGAGRGFCAGADISAVSQRTRGAAPRVRSRPISYPSTVGKPLVAAINGGCVGLGLLQALLCDVRFAVADAKIATGFARRGIPAEFGVSWLLQRLVGPAHAADLLLSARTIRGDEAAALGLVNRAFATREELMEATLAYGRDIAANCSPVAVAAIKDQLRADPYRSRQESEDDAVRLMTLPEIQPGFKEGVAAFVEKRAPRFEGLSGT